MDGVTIFSLYDRISLFHELAPFLCSKHRRLFTFTDSPRFCLSGDGNRSIILVRQFLKPDRVDLEFLRRIRDKYRRVFFFNGNAGGGIPRLEVLPYVDALYAKALFKDRGLYKRELYGGELYSDFYHREFGASDPCDKKRAVVQDEGELAKLRLYWNIGVGKYPRRELGEKIGVLVARTAGLGGSGAFFAGTDRLPPAPERPRTIAVHARLEMVSKPSVAYQRRLILDTIQDQPSFLTGRVSQRRYNGELSAAKITLSPFGWGELCLRDFEAVRAGSLLVKPDMSHLETWPDVFTAGET